MRKEYASLRRRPLFAPVWLAGLAAAIVIALATWLLASASTTTIIVMRHAEKSTLPADDPPLSPAGEARAETLAQMLGQTPAEFRIQAIFVSEFRRAQDTVRPLANRLGVPVIVVPAADTALVAKRARDEYRGGRVLIVGHSNTVPGIVEKLSGNKVPAMQETEYGVVYVIALPRFSRAAVTRFDFP
ncbi:MAG: histidine phosphatase family protein [Gammaproteobacteria bacterium]|nr:histidine phosphatase family protein [Gammaproteobacteria bacterium]